MSFIDFSAAFERVTSPRLQFLHLYERVQHSIKIKIFDKIDFLKRNDPTLFTFETETTENFEIVNF